ncbi:MAG: hypothetical protein E7393_06235 [Ruminococcaceae bacterium]|nr:hypothetical protein [Oscillospiraceae bacterium]
MNQFQVGFARRIITPEVGTRLYGYPGARVSETLHDDLYANVFAFQSNDEKCLLISLDLCTLPQERNAELRQAIAKATNIPANNMILATMHTHSGPSTSGSANSSSKGWGGPNMTYINDILFPETIATAKEAIAALQPAEMGIGETTSNAGTNRRELTPEGEVILGQNPDGPFDERMRVLAFRTLEGKPIASLVHYGCHPTAAWSTPDITRDWPGYMVDRLAEESGAPVAFFNGAEGDTGPNLSNGKTTGDMELMKEVGIIAGEDAVRAYKTIQEYHVPKLAVKVGMLSLPYQSLPTIEEAKAGIEALGNPDEIIEVGLLHLSRFKRIIEHRENNLPIETHWNFEQTYIALDSVVFVPFPMEMFCEISMNLQKLSPFTHTLTLSNANGSIGYLPTEDQIPYGGYEIDSFNAFNLFILENCADKQIVEANNNLLHTLFNE